MGVPPDPLFAGFELSDPLFHALGFGLQLLQILLQPGDLLFARDKVPPELRAGPYALARAASALAAVAVMLTVSTTAPAAVTGMGVLRAFAPVTLIAVTVAVVMLIMFTHLFHLLS